MLGVALAVSDSVLDPVQSLRDPGIHSRQLLPWIISHDVMLMALCSFIV